MSKALFEGMIFAAQEAPFLPSSRLAAAVQFAAFAVPRASLSIDAARLNGAIQARQIEGAILMRLHVSLLTSVAVALVGLAGCRSVATPTLAPQGDTAYQQYNAQRYDPFPEPDTAPEIVGARGREYEKPISSPSRSGLWLKAR